MYHINKTISSLIIVINFCSYHGISADANYDIVKIGENHWFFTPNIVSIVKDWAAKIEAASTKEKYDLSDKLKALFDFENDEYSDVVRLQIIEALLPLMLKDSQYYISGEIFALMLLNIDDTKSILLKYKPQIGALASYLFHIRNKVLFKRINLNGLKNVAYQNSLGWLYRKLMVANSEYLIEKIAKDEDVTEFLHKFYVPIIPKMEGGILIDFPHEQTEKLYTKPSTKTLSTFVYNHDGYNFPDVDKEKYPQFIKGKPLTLKDSNIPIGYNLYLPHTKPSGIIVHIYGGFSCFTLPALEMIRDLEFGLLKENIAVVVLNLPDNWPGMVSDDPEREQQEMSKEVFDAVHQGIHRFWQVIKESPDSLHPSLECLKGLNIGLLGHSFGGLNSVRHSQMYPATFDVYISLNGYVSSLVGSQTDLGAYEGRQTTDKAIKAREWLNADRKETIIKISESLLFIHNFDDSNVSVRQSVSCYNHACESGQGSLVRLLVLDKGSGYWMTPGFNPSGHSPTKNIGDFHKMISTMAGFVREGKHTISDDKSKLYAIYADIYSANNYKKISPLDKFMSLAYGLYDQSSPSNRTVSGIEKSWEVNYKPLLKSVFYISHLAKNQTLMQAEIKRLNNIIEMLKLRFLDQNLINEMIKRAVSSDASKIIEYLVKSTKSRPALSMKTDKINNILNHEYIDSLLDETTEYNIWLYLLNKLYTANPNLMEHSYFSDFTKKLEMDGIFDLAKQQFINKIKEISNLQGTNTPKLFEGFWKL